MHTTTIPPQPTAQHQHQRRPWPAPRRHQADQRRALSCLARAQAARRFALLLTTLVVLAGCGHEPRLSGYAVATTATAVGNQVAGPLPLIGFALPRASPTLRATPPPLRATMLPAPTVAPPPLSGIFVPTTEPLPPTAPATDPVAAADLIVQGRALQVNGLCTEAIPLYEKAIAADPSFSDVYSLLAFCLYDLGRYNAAIARWQQALQRAPALADALAGLGTARYRQGQRAAGLASYGQAIAVDPAYADEGYLLLDRLWGGPAILDSRPLRAQLAP